MLAAIAPGRFSHVHVRSAPAPQKRSCSRNPMSHACHERGAVHSEAPVQHWSDYGARLEAAPTPVSLVCPRGSQAPAEAMLPAAKSAAQPVPVKSGTAAVYAFQQQCRDEAVRKFNAVMQSHRIARPASAVPAQCLSRSKPITLQSRCRCSEGSQCGAQTVNVHFCAIVRLVRAESMRCQSRNGSVSSIRRRERPSSRQ